MTPGQRPKEADGLPAWAAENAGWKLLPLILGLPLLGALAAGRPLRRLLAFPPVNVGLGSYVRFSWWAVAAVLALLAAAALPWLPHLREPRSPAPDRPRAAARRDRFVPPALAAAWIALWWALAWIRVPALADLRRNAFFPLWLGFIVFVNGLTVRRTGGSLATRRPARWLGLFLVSAAFWWGFEWLNRFAQNWHYLGAASYGREAYALHATLCFSTVIPAVAAVSEWLTAGRSWHERRGPRWRWLGSRRAAWLLIVGGSAGLFLTGARPQAAYPALWLGPLALLLGEGALSARPGVRRELAEGDWSRALPWMMAALVCGFFWEMWNFLSWPRWSYTVPGVEGWHLFAMPLLGYAGYLPFGLECLLAARLAGVPWNSGGPAPNPEIS